MSAGLQVLPHCPVTGHLQKWPYSAFRFEPPRDNSRIVDPEVMMRIGSAGITSSLPVIRQQFRMGPCQISGRQNATIREYRINRPTCVLISRVYLGYCLGALPNLRLRRIIKERNRVVISVGDNFVALVGTGS